MASSSRSENFRVSITFDRLRDRISSFRVSSAPQGQGSFFHLPDFGKELSDRMEMSGEASPAARMSTISSSDAIDGSGGSQDHGRRLIVRWVGRLHHRRAHGLKLEADLVADLARGVAGRTEGKGLGECRQTASG
ncbi:MAG: hypothetical protein R3D63_02795 [Paracoccaceae bacterium]